MIYRQKNRKENPTMNPVNQTPNPTPSAERSDIDHMPTLSVEEQAATERLAAIAADLVSDDLRAEWLRSAQAQTLHRTLATAITEAQASTQTDLAAGDIQHAAHEAGRVADLARLIPMLPSVDLDPSIVADTRAKAAEYVRQAQLTVPPLPELSFTLELAAWRSLGNQMLITPPPAALLTDLAAEKAFVAHVARRSRVTATSTAFFANYQTGDILNTLGSAQGTADLLKKQAEDVTELSAIIIAANKARASAGIRYCPPDGISTPEIKALQAS